MKNYQFLSNVNVKINTINFKSSKIYIKSRTKRNILLLLISFSDGRARACVHAFVCVKITLPLVSNENFAQFRNQLHTRTHTHIQQSHALSFNGTNSYPHCLRRCIVRRRRIRCLETAAAGATALWLLLLLLLLLLLVAGSRRG